MAQHHNLAREAFAAGHRLPAHAGLEAYSVLTLDRRALATYERCQVPAAHLLA